MKRTNLLLTSCFIGLITPGLASANLIWHEYNGSQYALTSTWSTWADAQAEAQNYGGNLVTINDAAENSWLTTTFAGSYARNHDGVADHDIAWIGYNFNPTTNTWGWISGEAVTYTNPAFNFPYSGELAYMHLGAHPDPGTWNANPAHNDLFDHQPMGIIEREADAPATLLSLGLGLLGIAAVQRKKKARKS